MEACPYALFELLEQSVAIYEPDGTFVYVNATTERLFGHVRQDLVGRRIWDVFPNAVGNAFHQAFERVRTTGETESFDHHYMPWDRWFNNHIFRHEGRIHVVASDITDRKRAEARLTTLALLSEALAAARDLPATFDAVARVLSNQLGDSCGVLVEAPTGDTLVTAALHHPVPGTLAFLREAAKVPMPIGQGFAGRAHATGEAVLVPVVDPEAHQALVTNEPHRTSAARFRAHSLMAVPLRDGGRTTGVVVMMRDRTVRPFTQEDLDLLKDVAERAGLAVGRARLEQTEREASRLLNESSQTLTTIISAAPMAVMLLDDDGTVRLWNPAAERIFGWTASETLGRHLPAIPEGSRNEFSANLAKVLGGVSFAGVETKRLTRDRGVIDVELWAAAVERPNGRKQCLSVVADISARAREKARADLLAEASAVLASSLEVDEILQKLAALPVPAFADWCCVDLVTEDGWIDRVAVAHADPSKADVARRLKRRLAPRKDVRHGVTPAVSQGKPQLIRELTDEVLRAIARDEDHLACARAMEGKSAVVAPLLVGGRSVGAMVFTSTNHTYDETDLALVEELGRRAAAVLENARLYGTTRALVQRLENIQGVTSALSRARTPREVAAVLVRRAEQAVNADACMVWMAEPNGDLVLLDSHGVPELVSGLWQRLPAGSDAPAFRVIDDGLELWVETEEDYERTSPSVYARMKATGRIRSFATLPLWIEGKRAGVATYAFPLGHRFTPEEREFLSTLTRQCEQALERAHLFTREAEARGVAEEAQRQAEAASRSKDEFLAMLGHELRNPLAPIVTALQLMKLRNQSRTTREQEVIERQVAHLLRLVDDLLDVSRITRGKVTLKKDVIDLADAVAKAVEMASPLLEQKQHRLSVSVPRHGMHVEGDVVRLAQVLANLLTNAAKYTDAGGTIALVATRQGDEVTITVRDDGAGIEPELLPRVFDLFTQGPRSADRGQGGLGIGLALVRNLVQMHGGSVLARSEGAGRGSEFVVRLPALPYETVASDVIPNDVLPAPASVRRRRVLVVDDNADAADMLAEYLRAAGHEVVLAYDGAQALRAVEAFVPEVAFLDIGLPVMDGYELATRLKERHAVRMAALTGYGQEHDRARSIRAGFHAHFVKPVAPDQVLRYLEQ